MHHEKKPFTLKDYLGLYRSTWKSLPFWIAGYLLSKMAEESNIVLFWLGNGLIIAGFFIMLGLAMKHAAKFKQNRKAMS